MESLLNKKVELSPVPLREGYIHCDVCGGISWLLHKDNYIIPCICVNGLVKVCSECDEPMGHNSYACKNSNCIDKLDQAREDIRIQKAMQLDVNDERVKNCKMFYSSTVQDCYNEGYYPNIEDYIEHSGDGDVLNYDNSILWLCEGTKFDIDVDSVLENELDDHYEDAYHNLSDIDELRKIVAKWCEKQNIITYHSGNKYYVRVTEDMYDTTKTLA